jgi:predicted CXXCH cytochrome family protein
MKKILLVAGLLILAGGLGYAQITGSPHDLSSVSGDGNTFYSTDQTQICIFCHTPHYASAAQKPLWNRNDPGSEYATYWSPTIDAYTEANTPNISGVSKQCLSCHDGVTALNSLIYNGGLGAAPTMANDDEVINTTADLVDGVNGLTNDHPVSFSYADAAATDNDLKAANQLPGWALDGDGKVQCSSCHDVHSYGATAAMQPFLNASKSGSALCLQCHDK